MRIFIPLAILFLLATNAFSATRTWDGGGANGNWNNAANWVDDIAPAANDDLVFPAVSAQFVTTHNYSGTIFNSVTFEGGAYTVDGNLFSPLATRSLNVTAGAQTFNVPVNASGAAVFTSGQGALATIISLSVSSSGLTLDGAGSFGIGAIGGSGPITKNGLGAALVTTTLFGFTGAINLNNGIFVVDANIPNAPVTVNSPTIGGGELGFSGFGGTGNVGNVNVIQGAISGGTLQSPTGILGTRNLTFTANGNYAVKIGGTTPGANGHDQLNVTGTVTLANARLAPIPWNNFRPAIGDTFVILRNDGADAIVGTFLNAPEGAIFGGALNTAFRITYVGGDGNDIAITRVARSQFDFDGDGRSDISIFRPSTADWWYLSSVTGQQIPTRWGFASDLLTPADFDGDNKTDFSVFRPSDGTWYTMQSSTSTAVITQFGVNGDRPMPNDFDGDGRADIAVFRPSTGVWYQLRSLTGQAFIQQFGRDGDVPLPVDYDGDGMGDMAVFRPSDSTWHFLNSSDGAYTALPFGAAGDKPVPADYNGDGRTDIATFRPSNNPDLPDFYILTAGTFNYYGSSWGTVGDIPAVADYDGDGRADISVYRPSTNNWFVLRSTAGFYSTVFGTAGDRPVANAYVP
jgi:hypothetical protein